MKCEELLAMLGDYVDGDMDREVYETFRSHMEGCNPCEVVVDNIRHSISLYKCGKTVELPEELQQQLRHVLRKRWEAIFPRPQEENKQQP